MTKEDEFRCMDCSRRFRWEERRQFRSFSGVKRESCPGCSSQNFISLPNLYR